MEQLWARCSNGRATDCKSAASASWFDSNLAHKRREMNKIEFSEYMRRRYADRRVAAIELLGGKCSKCGSSKKLQFDHIDRKSKAVNIADLWRHSWKRILIELEKCQLLCECCHTEKSKPELAQVSRSYQEAHRKITTTRLVCYVCGKEVVKLLWRLKQHPRTTCSKKCTAKLGGLAASAKLKMGSKL